MGWVCRPDPGIVSAMEVYTLAQHSASNGATQVPNVRELGKSYMMYKIGEFNIYFK